MGKYLFTKKKKKEKASFDNSYYNICIITDHP